jgi:hypothetical protein
MAGFDKKFNFCPNFSLALRGMAGFDKKFNFCSFKPLRS